MPYTRTGSIYLTVLIMLTILIVFGLAFNKIVSSERHQSSLSRDMLVAGTLSESGINMMLVKIAELEEEPLLKEDGSVNEKKLSLLNYQRLKDFSLVYSSTDLVEGGKVTVVATVQNYRQTPFDCGLNTEEELPLELKPFKIDPKTKVSSSKIGGWEGHLKILSTGEFRKRKYTIEVIKGIKVMDLSPCAPLHTLFIQGRNREVLRTGKFILSNWEFSGPQFTKFSDTLKKLTGQAGEILDKVGGMDLFQLIQVIKSFVMLNTDLDQKNAAEQLIMSLKPWGYVRHNGVNQNEELSVFLPFFEVDDVINYFVLNPYFQRPEVGYPGCNSRLHDLYMAKYTRYEGNIMKNYYRLAPYILQKQYPREITDKYTRYSTYSYYPTQYADEFHAENFKRYLENSRDFSCQISTNDQRLVGTRDNPIHLNGLHYIVGDLYLEGVVKGKGTIFVKGGNVKLTGNVEPADDSSCINLFVSDGYCYLEREGSCEFNGAIYSKQSIKSGKKISIHGNLVVDTLNRQQGDVGSVVMPENVEIYYQPEIRNIMADNIVISVSRVDLIRRKI
ncbi:MAG: hypothetical protein PHQ23_00725 [Candidatus Wallbacteria bacterium]|nr:hypothetical protein [Candidatus Wallbacteria bacterium]